MHFRKLAIHCFSLSIILVNCLKGLITYEFNISLNCYVKSVILTYPRQNKVMTTKSNKNNLFLCDIPSFQFTFSVIFLSSWDNPNCSNKV